MTLYQSFILGIVQGATEFLPISSSGHLVLAPYVFGWHIPPLEAYIFDVLIQVATFTAVLIYYWKELLQIIKSMFQGISVGKPLQNTHARLGWYLIIATIPAGLAAVLFKNTFEKSFSSPKLAAIFLICTSLFLIAAEVFGSRTRSLETVSGSDALLIGFFQILALFPGISRSGSTISGAMLRGLNRESAAKFSFLMAVPVMFAAGIFAVWDLVNAPGLVAKLPIYSAGFITAALVGYLSIHWFISYLSKHSFYLFAGYCALLGSGFLLLLSR